MFLEGEIPTLNYLKNVLNEKTRHRFSIYHNSTFIMFSKWKNFRVLGPYARNLSKNCYSVHPTICNLKN